MLSGPKEQQNILEIPFVSLVIPTYNREEYLVETLRCAFALTYPRLEIIVVDQTKQHKKETLDFLQQHASRFTLIYNEVPGVTRARNTGVQHAQGEMIVFTDDDVTFSADFIERHVEAMQHYRADIISGRVLEKGCRIGQRPPWISPFLFIRGKGSCAVDGRTNDVTGCNFSFKKEVWEKIGGFDERFQKIAVREDSDFAYRAFLQGFRLMFSAKAELFHHRATSGGVDTGIKNHFFDGSYYQSELLFARKNFSYFAVQFYKLRLILRGLKAFRKLFRLANRNVIEMLGK